jgi:hypothetical protein
MKKAVEKAAENLREQEHNYRRSHAGPTTDIPKKNPKKDNNQVGEYVDYEEIE